MTPAPISVERLRELLEKALDGVTVAPSGCVSFPTETAHLSVSFLAKHGAALLHQLAELEQKYRESCDITRDWIAANNALSARAEAAESKLAEREAAYARLYEMKNDYCDRLEAAECARDEAEIMLSVFTTLGAQVMRTSCGRYRINSEPETDRGTARESIAAFLAASGGK